MNTKLEKPRFPRAAALAVAKEICDALRPATSRLIVAGSLRRRKDAVGDVEIVFVPRLAERQEDLFESTTVSLADVALDILVSNGVLMKRLNAIGSSSWGSKNRLAIHVSSAVPVDFFSATDSNWFNYLVCRTGGAQSNMNIASSARRKGWMWHPYGPGFTNAMGEIVPVTSERDVFEFVGQPYREPWERI